MKAYILSFSTPNRLKMGIWSTFEGTVCTGEEMKRNLIINLTKEYLKLAILPYSLEVLVWALMLFIGGSADWALAAGGIGSLMLILWGWKMIFIDASKGRCCGLYLGLPVSSAKQQSARVFAAAMGIVIVLAGVAAMTVLILETIEFWGAQYVYGSGGLGSKHYARWLYGIYLEGGGTL